MAAPGTSQDEFPGGKLDEPGLTSRSETRAMKDDNPVLKPRRAEGFVCPGGKRTILKPTSAPNINEVIAGRTPVEITPGRANWLEFVIPMINPLIPASGDVNSNAVVPNHNPEYSLGYAAAICRSLNLGLLCIALPSPPFLACNNLVIFNNQFLSKQYQILSAYFD